MAAIETHAGKTALDFLMLTGDLAYSGLAKQYEQLEKNLLDPLREIDVASSARIVAVPGNHDLNCDIAHPISWENLGRNRQPEFFLQSEQGLKIRQARAEGFRAYEDFSKRRSVITCWPTMAPTEVKQVTGSSGKEVNLICVNTAYFSDRDTTDKERAPAPTDALRESIKRLDTSKQTIVLGHHPFNWFMRESTYQFKAWLI